MKDYNPLSLRGKRILVTGGSSGIGRATAIECASLGASVVIVGRNEERLASVLAELDTSEGQEHVSISADLTTMDGLDKIVEKNIIYDGVLSNAGSPFCKPIKFVTNDDLERSFRLMVFSHVLLAKSLFRKRLLAKGASYVFTSSIGGVYIYSPGDSTYGMGKSAIASFMKYCAIEFAPRGIRVNAVCPGMIDTPFIRDGAVSEDQHHEDAETYLLKRYGTPEEVAHCVSFLLSDASSFVDGTTLVADGGYSVTH